MAEDDIPGILPKYPDKTSGEAAYQAARIAVGAADLIAPLAGQGLQKLLDRFVGAPLEERRDKWFALVGEKIEYLLARDGRLEELHSGEFLDTIIEATSVALKSRHDEKREALANAVANAATGMKLDDVLRGAFIACVDRFSPAHLVMLRLLDRPSLNFQEAERAVQLLQQSQEGLLGGPRTPAEDEVISVRVLTDLSREGLVSASLNQTAATPEQALQRTTAIGKAFLAYISLPS